MAQIDKIKKDSDVFGTNLQTFLQQTDHFWTKYIQCKWKLHIETIFVNFWNIWKFDKPPP